MISLDKQYRTRDGREVRLYALDGALPYSIHGAIKTEHGWVRASWALNGEENLGANNLDLIEVRPRIKRTVFLHVFENSTVCAAEDAYYKIANRLACIRVEIDCEEGEGL